MHVPVFSVQIHRWVRLLLWQLPMLCRLAPKCTFAFNLAMNTRQSARIEKLSLCNPPDTIPQCDPVLVLRLFARPIFVTDEYCVFMFTMLQTKATMGCLLNTCLCVRSG